MPSLRCSQGLTARGARRTEQRQSVVHHRILVAVCEAREAFVFRTNRLEHGIDQGRPDANGLRLTFALRSAALAVEPTDDGEFVFVQHGHVLLASPAPEPPHGLLPRLLLALWRRSARPVRFHDLLLKAEVPLATVQRILRHTGPAVTSEIYGHLDLGVNKLSFQPTGSNPLKLVR